MWLTAMGLTIGLLMVAYLVGLILVEGLAAFWPKRIAQIELREDHRAHLAGRFLAGKLVKIQAKALQNQDTAAQAEWQIMVGNKDAYGFGFLYIDEADVVAWQYPRDLMVIERLEYGEAIGIPLALSLHGGTIIPATAAEFTPRFQSLVADVNQRRQVIRRLEKHDIGRINHRMEDLRLQQRLLEQAQPPGSAVPDATLAPIQRAMTTLQAEYEVLAQQARTLRLQQEEHRLLYRLATGEERQLILGQIVQYTLPNQLTTLQRLGLFLHNMWRFWVEEPREANTEGGVFPAIFGTLVMTLLMSVAVTPFGVLAALYLREYAQQGLAVRTVRIAVNNLAGVPSIVFGVFGLGFFVYLVGGTIDQLFFSATLPTPTFGTGGILWAASTLALMTVPVVIVATEEALAAVPRGMREGSLACGASKWQTIQRVVLPAAAPGILTGLILAMARGAGEVAPLMLVGVVKLAPTLPLDNLFPFVHLDRKFMHLGFHIYDLGFQSPDADAARPMVFATTLLLIALIVLLNVTAIFVRDRLRKKYATGAF